MKREFAFVCAAILAVATTPLLTVFNDYLIHEDETFARAVKRRLSAMLEGRSPSLWTIELSGVWGQSIHSATAENIPVRLEHLTQNARIPEVENLPCVCLLMQRGSSRTFLPAPETRLLEGDTLLFAGRGGARREMLFALREPTALVSVASGRHHPRGAIMRKLAKKRSS